MLVNKPINEYILKAFIGCFGSRASPFAQTIIVLLKRWNVGAERMAIYWSSFLENFTVLHVHLVDSEWKYDANYNSTYNNGLKKFCTSISSIISTITLTSTTDRTTITTTISKTFIAAMDNRSISFTTKPQLILLFLQQWISQLITMELISLQVFFYWKVNYLHVSSHNNLGFQNYVTANKR